MTETYMKLCIRIFFFSIYLLGFGCSTKQTHTDLNHNKMKVSLFTMNQAPELGTTLSGQKIKMGGFSGLNFISEDDQNLYFQTLTDRGPNGEVVGKARPFLIPAFSPSILILKADKVTNELSLINKLELKKISGLPLTGFPNNPQEENPINIFGQTLAVDKDGLDPEGITPDNLGGWWLSEEYGPSLVHFNKEGIMQKRLLPAEVLPQIYSQRKSNRGFEGITKFQHKLFGILQSPLPGEKNFARIVEVDLEKMVTSAEYFYPFHEGNDKVGDIFAISEKSFLVLEQNGRIGDNSQKYIYLISLNEANRPVKKVLIANLRNTPFNDVEKVEGLAIIDNHRLALVYDNDFQINGKTDFKTGITSLNDKKNQLIILEFENALLTAPQ